MTVTSISTSVISETDEALTALQRALLRAKVQILDEDEVKAFQDKKLAEMRKAGRLRFPWIRVPSLYGVAAACAGVFMLAALAGLLAGLPSSQACLCGMVATGFPLAFLSVVLAFRPSAITRRLEMSLLKWRTYPAGYVVPESAYLLPSFHAAGVGVCHIPIAAHLIAEGLAQAGALAAFEVEQLDNDPFLFVTMSGERYCLFAWDEEGYIPR